MRRRASSRRPRSRHRPSRSPSAGPRRRKGWRVRAQRIARFQFSNSQEKIHVRIPAARCARVLQKPSAQERAWGMPGARCTRSLVCSVLVAHECSHHGRTGITRHSRTRMVLTASFALSPVIGLSCHRHRRKFISANLTPASRRQDHTTSPSAPALFVKSAAASTAFPPYVRDDRETPLSVRPGWQAV